MNQPEVHDSTLEGVAGEYAAKLGLDRNRPSFLEPLIKTLEDDTHLAPMVLERTRAEIIRIARSYEWYPQIMAGIEAGSDAERDRLAAFYRCVVKELTERSVKVSQEDLDAAQ